MKINATYLVRLDDACPTMDWRRWERIVALLDAYHIKPIIGVIPDNKDSTFHIDPPRADFWDVICQWYQMGCTIGFHGYQHRYVTQEGGMVPLNRKSEFAGLSLQIQEEKIRNGWKIFQSHQIEPTVWVAPAHSFDEKTLIALKNNTDIIIVSDGIALNCFMNQNFYWIPQQLWQFRKMPFGTYTICLHPNTMNERAFLKLEKNLEEYAHRFTSLSNLKLLARPKNNLEKIITRIFIMRSKILFAIKNKH